MLLVTSQQAKCFTAETAERYRQLAAQAGFVGAIDWEIVGTAARTFISGLRTSGPDNPRRCDSCWDAILRAMPLPDEIHCAPVDLGVRLEGFEPPTF